MGINPSLLSHKSTHISDLAVEVKGAEKQLVVHKEQPSPIKVLNDLVSYRVSGTTTTSSPVINDQLEKEHPVEDYEEEENNISMYNIRKQTDLSPTKQIKKKRSRENTDNSKPTRVLPVRGTKASSK